MGMDGAHLCRCRACSSSETIAFDFANDIIKLKEVLDDKEERRCGEHGGIESENYASWIKGHNVRPVCGGQRDATSSGTKNVLRRGWKEFGGSKSEPFQFPVSGEHD